MKESQPERLFVSHGDITHKLGNRCESCDKAKADFEKAQRDGTLDAILKGKLTD